jgi:ferredoxin
VARFPGPADLPGKFRKQVIIGAKNCDLAPLQVHRKLLVEQEPADPSYQQRLSESLIVSADCPEPEATCFCNLLGYSPYVETGSDVNLTALEEGYLVEPISARGNDLVFGRDKPFRPATDDEVEQRDLRRRQAVARLREINPAGWPDNLPERIDRKKEDGFWRAAGKDCVECYGCLMVCPTCFCYLLYDQTTGPSGDTTGFDRVRVWDACYYQGYARVGGGTNARPRMWERFRNRFHCKWMNSTRAWGFHSCSGCGRCYSVCMGRIDIRKVLGAV